MCSVYKFMQVGQEIDGSLEGGARRGGQADSAAAGKGGGTLLDQEGHERETSDRKDVM